MTRHIVIIIYIIELCAACAMITGFESLWGNQNLDISSNEKYRSMRKLLLQLFALMVVRLVIKSIYFYIEYYIRTMPINLVVDFLMDSSYVLSLHCSLNLVEYFLGKQLRFRKAVTLAAGLIYTFGFTLVQLIWLDPYPQGSTLNIPAGPASICYIFNEEVLMISMMIIMILYLVMILRRKEEIPHVRECIVLLVNNIWYILYVNLWNLSYLNDRMEFLRLLKPLDGLHFYMFVLLVLFWSAYRRQEKALHKQRIQAASIQKEHEDAVVTTPAPAVNAAGDHLTDSLEDFARRFGLTKREVEIFKLLVEGKSYQDIADELVISLNTVKRHCSNIYQKCEVKNRAQLTAMVGNRQ